MREYLKNPLRVPYLVVQVANTQIPNTKTPNPSPVTGQTQTQKNQRKNEIELEYKIGALETAIEDLQHLDDVLWDLMDMPYARFAESALEWYENDDDIKYLLPEINEIANMIDEMPDEIREYLENIQDKIPRIIKKLKHRVHELEKQLGNEGGEP